MVGGFLWRRSVKNEKNNWNGWLMKRIAFLSCDEKKKRLTLKEGGKKMEKKRRKIEKEDKKNERKWRGLVVLKKEGRRWFKKSKK